MGRGLCKEGNKQNKAMLGLEAEDIDRSLTLEEARAAITEVMEAFRAEENAEKMREAKAEAMDNTFKFMSLVYPIALQVQLSVIEKYGFPADHKGLLSFTQALRHHASDPEVFKLSNELKNALLPPRILTPAPTQD
eukprot:c6095_g1_i1.p1 GENE.c6095_g1_i1~~c6095_g1_i1.p1  ORF type:complete len:136 (-),score=48.31 c6095_g1_i1:137-544(-)